MSTFHLGNESYRIPMNKTATSAEQIHNNNIVDLWTQILGLFWQLTQFKPGRWSISNHMWIKFVKKIDLLPQKEYTFSKRFWKQESYLDKWSAVIFAGQVKFKFSGYYSCSFLSKQDLSAEYLTARSCCFLYFFLLKKF